VRGATTPLATTLKEQADAPAGSAAAALVVGRSFEFALLLVTGIEAASPAVQEALLEARTPEARPQQTLSRPR